MKTKKFTLYSKFCVGCIWPKKLKEFRSYIMKNGYTYEYKRTAYRPSWHKEASEIYGSEDYKVFFTDGNKVVDLLTWECATKKKPVTKTKKKGLKDAEKEGQ